MTETAANVTSRLRNWLFGLTIAVAATIATSPTAAAHTRSSAHHHTATHLASRHGAKPSHALASSHNKSTHAFASRQRREHWKMARLDLHHRRYASAQFRHSGLQCVPYAREVSHIQLSGDAFLWWAEAAGRYARGNEPVEGAVLNFRAVGRMPLGHVAVVTAVIDSRTILVTQANWVRGTITNDVTMQDTSPNNDWSQVQVELGDTSTWGAAYPTYGFIYNQPDTGTTIANNAQSTEVAEAPRAVTLQTDAPDRNLQ